MELRCISRTVPINTSACRSTSRESFVGGHVRGGGGRGDARVADEQEGAGGPAEQAAPGDGGYGAIPKFAAGVNPPRLSARACGLYVRHGTLSETRRAWPPRIT